LKNNNHIFVKNISGMNWKNCIWGGALSVLLFSCGTRQEINYMKDIENLALDNSVKIAEVLYSLEINC
jgi:polysaccharide export outer membrane protein